MDGATGDGAAPAAAAAAEPPQPDRAALAALPAAELVRRAAAAAGEARAARVAAAGLDLTELLAQAAATSVAASAAAFDAKAAPLLEQLRKPNNPVYLDTTCPACGDTKHTKDGMKYHLQQRVCPNRAAKQRKSEGGHEELLRLEYACPLCARAFATLDGVTKHCASLPCCPTAGRKRARRPSRRGEEEEEEEDDDDDEEDEDEEDEEDDDDGEDDDASGGGGGSVAGTKGATAARRASSAAAQSASSAARPPRRAAATTAVARLQRTAAPLADATSASAEGPGGGAARGQGDSSEDDESLAELAAAAAFPGTRPPLGSMSLSQAAERLAASKRAQRWQQSGGGRGPKRAAFSPAPPPPAEPRSASLSGYRPRPRWLLARSRAMMLRLGAGGDLGGSDGGQLGDDHDDHDDVAARDAVLQALLPGAPSVAARRLLSSASAPSGGASGAAAHSSPLLASGGVFFRATAAGGGALGGLSLRAETPVGARRAPHGDAAAHGIDGGGDVAHATTDSDSEDRAAACDRTLAWAAVGVVPAFAGAQHPPPDIGTVQLWQLAAGERGSEMAAAPTPQPSAAIPLSQQAAGPPSASAGQPRAVPFTLHASLAAVVAYRGGAAVDVAWSPAAAPDDFRLGVLAVACADGAVRLFAIPRVTRPSPASGPVVLALLPHAVLEAPSAPGSPPPAAAAGAQPVVLAWSPCTDQLGPVTLAVGYSDGSTRVCDVGRDPPGGGDDRGDSRDGAAIAVSAAPTPPAAIAGSSVEQWLADGDASDEDSQLPVATGRAAASAPALEAPPPHEVVTHTIVAAAALPPPAPGCGQVCSLDWSPLQPASQLCVAHASGAVRLWHVVLGSSPDSAGRASPVDSSLHSLAASSAGPAPTDAASAALLPVSPAPHALPTASLTCARFAPDGLSLLLADVAGRLRQLRLATAAYGSADDAPLVDTAALCPCGVCAAVHGGLPRSVPIAVTDVCVVARTPAAEPKPASSSSAVVLASRHALVAMGTGDGGSCVLSWPLLEGSRGAAAASPPVCAVPCMVAARGASPSAGAPGAASASSSPAPSPGDVSSAAGTQALAAGITLALPRRPAASSGRDAPAFEQLATQLLGLAAVRHVRAAVVQLPAAPRATAHPRSSTGASRGRGGALGRGGRKVAVNAPDEQEQPPEFVLVCVATAAGGVTAVAVPAPSAVAAAADVRV